MSVTAGTAPILPVYARHDVTFVRGEGCWLFDDAEELLDAGSLDGGILPKLRAAVTAARVGVHAEIGETVVRS